MIWVAKIGNELVGLYGVTAGDKLVIWVFGYANTKAGTSVYDVSTPCFSSWAGDDSLVGPAFFVIAGQRYFCKMVTDVPTWTTQSTTLPTAVLQAAAAGE